MIDVRPAWRVVLDGQDLTARLAPRLLDLTLTECRGGEADQLDLRIHDHDGALALPARGVELSVAIGWEGSGLVDKGTFRVDEVEHSGAPDIITVRARSADLTQPLRTQRERSWHAVTLGAILQTLASDHGLRAQIAPELAAIAIPHMDQTESDAALMTRLASRYDAVATVKAGVLIFAPIGAGVTASGAELPRRSIVRTSGDQHRFSIADRDVYSGVRAYWHDKGAATRKSVLVGRSGNAKRLRESYVSETEARDQATAEWNRLQRGAAKFSFTLARGDAALYPEQLIDVAGFKAVLDAEWLISKVTHSITGSAGFSTSLELESPLATEDAALDTAGDEG